MAQFIFSQEIFTSDGVRSKSVCVCSEEEKSSPSKELDTLKPPTKKFKKTKQESISEEESEVETHACSKKCNEYCIHGINILNKESLEIHQIQERIRRRKEQHTKVEKRRRNFINSTIEQLAQELPPSYINHKCRNARGLILQQTLEYVKALHKENASLKNELAKKNQS